MSKVSGQKEFLWAEGLDPRRRFLHCGQNDTLNTMAFREATGRFYPGRQMIVLENGENIPPFSFILPRFAILLFPQKHNIIVLATEE